MNERLRFFADAADLAARGQAFATATIVRAERPTSAKPGARAIVTAEGTLHGWIGGSCAAPVVVREALAAIVAGEPRLIVLSDRASTSRAGVRHFPMTCHSGGELEIYIEPQLPPERLVVIGTTPVARALATLASTLGFEVTAGLSGASVDERSAIVVASRGDGDEEALREALATPARYVALVASRTRGDATRAGLAGMGLSTEALQRLRYPAGLDLHARSEEEIALSILAEVVATRAQRVEAALTAEALDPVCGMSVAITEDALRAVHEDVTYYFCSAGCLRRFLANPAAVLASAR